MTSLLQAPITLLRVLTLTVMTIVVASAAPIRAQQTAPDPATDVNLTALNPAQQAVVDEAEAVIWCLATALANDDRQGWMYWLAHVFSAARFVKMTGLNGAGMATVPDTVSDPTNWANGASTYNGQSQNLVGISPASENQVGLTDTGFGPAIPPPNPSAPFRRAFTASSFGGELLHQQCEANYMNGSPQTLDDQIAVAQSEIKVFEATADLLRLVLQFSHCIVWGNEAPLTDAHVRMIRDNYIPHYEGAAGAWRDRLAALKELKSEREGK